ncbi:MAG: hypothetical protein ABEI98_05790 [Halorhabdus sp.]
MPASSADQTVCQVAVIDGGDRPIDVRKLRSPDGHDATHQRQRGVPDTERDRSHWCVDDQRGAVVAGAVHGPGFVSPTKTAVARFATMVSYCRL